MHPELSLVTTVAAALGMALIAGFLAAKLRLPALVGYLLAGILIGPATPGYVADIGLAQQLAEIGVMLLMFGVGLHFSLADLLQVRGVAVPGALVQMAISTGAGWLLGRVWGWTPASSLVFGLSVSIASTVVLIRALESRGQLETLNGRIAVGWLVVEDLAMVVVLVVLPVVLGFAGGPKEPFRPAVVVPALALAVAFVASMLVLGKRLLPWILWQVAKTGSRELFTLSVVAIAVGIAFGASKVFGVSFALGAFLAGMVLRGSDLGHRAAEESLPLREAFSVLFFVSVGMLFDPRVFVEHPFQLLAALGLVVVFNGLASFCLVLLFRYPLNTALLLGAGTAQIGEFSFVLMGLGARLGVVGPMEQSLVLGAAILSIGINPVLFTATGPVCAWIRGKSRLARFLERPADPLASLPYSTDQQYLSGQVVLVGYDHTGRALHRSLKESGIRCVVVDPNRELIESLRAQGDPAVSGTPTDPMVLVQAHIARAGMLLVVGADLVDLQQMLETARTLNPRIEISVCTHSEDEAELLEKEGVGRVFLAHAELTRAVAGHVRQRYGTSEKH